MANLNEMRISEFLDVLNYLIDNNRKLEESGQPKLAINIEGEAGIGKTSIVEELARKRGMTFCKLNLSMLEEVGDLTGFPCKEVLCKWTKNGETKTRWWPENMLSRVPEGVQITNTTRMGYAPPAWLPREENPNGVILLLDDYTRANPLFMQATMDLINEGRYISWTLPKNTTIILTTNPDNGEFAVQSLDSAQATRFLSFGVKLNVEDWAKWAEFNSIDSRAINFCMVYGEEIFRKHNGIQTVNPRAYTMFCRAISSVPDWENPDSLAFILSISKGCFLKDTDNIIGGLFTTFIDKKLDQLIPPKDMLMEKWETAEPRIHSSVYRRDNESEARFKPEIASILGTRLLNYILYYFSQKGSKEDVVQNRLLDFINNPRKLLSEDLLFHIIKTIVKQYPGRSGKLLLDPRIRNKIII